MLDMGTIKYGDCLVITKGTKTILIDGAHPEDADSIRAQLKKVLQKDAPFKIDLLIVTHCHRDHIGCLPALVNAGDLKIKTALVADEKIGWGKVGTDGADAAELNTNQKILLAALLEENHADLPDDELMKFLEDAITLEKRYKDMLKKLDDGGTKVIRYTGKSTKAIKDLESSFKSFGLKIIGPTAAHLQLCADALANVADWVSKEATEDLDDNSSDEDIRDAYRYLARQKAVDALGAEDRPGPGAAKNDQSIVIKLKSDGWTALLAADMQFAKPEVKDLTAHMKTLRDKISNEGPYDFVKLTHHASYNGLDKSVLAEFKDTKNFAHTGGTKDASHPDEGVLEILKEVKDKILFARTDRNGIITITKDGNKVKMKPSKGSLNDFSENEDTTVSVPATMEKNIVPQQSTFESKPKEETTIVSHDGEFVEVITKVPHTTTRVTITIEVDPEKKKIVSGTPITGPEDGTWKIAGGRTLPPLLFVTCYAKLQSNIGNAAPGIINKIRNTPNVQLLDIDPSLVKAEDVAPIVRKKLNEIDPKGVVIIGGYDVVPSQQLDVLDKELRKALITAGKERKDADGFIVWSDDLYGDKEGDLLAEIPVSRIPDARDANFLRTALQANSFKQAGRFGIRNYARPFAEETFSVMPGSGKPIEVSADFGPGNVKPNIALGAVYYMLHGSDRDGSRFWGETDGGEEYEAFSIDNIPPASQGSVVFTGCCWGALTVFQPAARFNGNTPAPRNTTESIALSYLKAGALAFIGCTGSHYSPLKKPYNYYGKPMHDEFWKGIIKGVAPAEALFNAKKEYAKKIPHDLKDIFSLSIEVKILRQYTCLGLGW